MNKLRKSILLTILALFLPMTQAWAGNGGSFTGWAKLTANASPSGAGTVYVSDSAIKSTDGLSSAKTASATSETSAPAAAPTSANVTFYVKAVPANDNYGFTGWSTGSNVQSIGNAASAETTVVVTSGQSNVATPLEASVTATFAKLCALSFLATENGTYSVTDGASTIAVTSEAKSLSTGKEVTMTATPAPGFTVKEWWYQEEGGSRVSLGNEKSYKHTFGADATVGVEFMVKGETIVNKTTGEKFFGLAAAVEAVKSGETLELLDDEDLASDVTLPTSVSLVVPQQKTLTIPQGVALSNSGTIMLSGVILNSGEIAGSGTLAKNYATVTQESTIHVPFPYGTDGKEVGQGVADVDGTAGKYVVTSTEKTDHAKSKIGSCSCDVRWYIAVNTAAGESFMSGMTTDEPVGVLCKVNRKIALNWITSVGEAYTTITVGTAATDMSPKMGYENNYKDGDGLFVLVRDASPAVGGKSSVYAYGAFDCAGHSLTFSEYQFNGNYILRFFNGVGKIEGSNHVMNIHVMFYGCETGSAATRMSLNNTGYLSSVSLYDSPDVSVSWYGNKAGDGVKYNIYGGGPYKPSYQKFSHVYWGTFDANSDPTQYLADSTHYTVFQRADKTWEVVRKEPDPNANAARINGDEYATLDLALKAATGGQRIEVLKDIVLQEDLVVGSATDATLDLSGYSISGPFTLENHGALEIVDDSGCVTPSDVAVDIVNKAGHLYLGAATYSGTITLDGGKCDILSGAYKNEVCVGADVQDPSDVLEITLGKFAGTTYRHGTEHPNLVDLIPHGHVRSDNDVYHIGKIPMAYVTGNSQSYSIRAFGTTDEETLYKKTLESTRRSAYDSRATWIRAMEMDAGRDLVGSYSIDCTMVFDRDVAANTVAGSTVGMKLPLKEFAAANVVKSVLLPGIRDSDPTQVPERAPWSYGQFMPGGEHSSISLTVTSEDCNVGTTCRLQMRYAPHVRWQSGGRQYDYVMSQSALAAECVFVFGAGSNVAMIQKTGGADFYANVQDAVDAVVSEGTVKLCNDVLDAVVVKVSKPCTIDLNGFAFNGSFEAPAGYEMVRTGDVVTFEAVGVEITVDDVANMDKIVTVNGEIVEATDGNTFLVMVGSDVAVTYTAKPGYVGGPITKRADNVQAGGRIEATPEDNAVAKFVVAQVTVGETTTKYTSLDDALAVSQSSGVPILVLGEVPETVPDGFKKVEVGGKTILVAAASPEVVVLAPDSETFAVTAKDEDGQSIAVPAGADAVADAAQAKVAAAGTAVVFEGTGVLDEEVCPLDVVVAALQAAKGVTEAERAQITAASEIRRYVSVQLTAVEVTAAAAFAGLSFDVKPMAKTFVIDAAGGVKVVVAQIPNDELRGGITFRLPLTDAFTASARIVHADDAGRLVRVAQAADGKRYVTVTATHFSIFTVYPDSHVESALTTSNVLAIKRVPGVAGAAAGTEVVAAVPWRNVALTDDVTVDRLVATGVAAGDEIAAWMDGAKTYYTWRWNGTAWEPATDAKTGVPALAASATTLRRGTAVWYKRANPSSAYSQVGGYDPATVTTAVTQGGATSEKKPANTLLINPYDEAVDLTKIPGASGDQIQTLADKKVYTYKDGRWGTMKFVETTTPFGPVKQQQFVAATGPVVVPAGQGFWYISKGGAQAIDWKAIKAGAQEPAPAS